MSALRLLAPVLLMGCSAVGPHALPTVPEQIAGDFDEDIPSIVLFADFACPFCRTQFDQLQRFHARSPGVRLHLYFVPSTEQSLKLAEVELCARQQGLGDEATLAILRRPLASQREGIDLVVAQGADLDALRACVEEPATINRLLEHVSISQRLGVTGLPTMFVREERFDGVVSPRMLDESVRRQWRIR